MNKLQVFDYIIVGGGIAGLYSAYILTKYKTSNILLLEKNEYLGGRMNNDMFEGEQIVTGAGIGRKHADVLLLNLLNEMGVEYNEFDIVMKCAPSIPKNTSINSTHKMLKKFYNYNPQNTTFKKFAKPILGSSNYKNFCSCMGYKDYENQDVYEVLYHYGVGDNDNDHVWTGFSPKKGWVMLVKKLQEHLIKSGVVIKTSCQVSEFFKYESGVKILAFYNNNEVYQGNNIILATTALETRKLMNSHGYNYLYDNINSQPFIRVYCKFDKPSRKILGNTHYKVGNILQQIIPFNHEKGIYLIAYSDNKAAEILKKYLEKDDTRYFSRLVTDAIKSPIPLHIKKIKGYYHAEGTHYYPPLPMSLSLTRRQFISKAQHPEKHVYVVGEMISRSQGWINGALKSTKILNI